ncbi:MAG: type II toxin-antitoxin system VapC family toxin [Pseudomonadota bacterium]
MTVALDTNVLIRLMVEDDKAQLVIARDLLSRDCSISATVLLEVEWVLRSFYRWPREVIAESLGEIIDLPTVSVSPTGVRWAIDRFAQGADLADMMHIASALGATAFATFDRQVGRHAGANSPVPIETLA